MKLTKEELFRYYPRPSPGSIESRANCLGEDELARAAMGALNRPERDRVADHLAACSECVEEFRLIRWLQPWPEQVAATAGDPSFFDGSAELNGSVEKEEIDLLRPVWRRTPQRLLAANRLSYLVAALLLIFVLTLGAWGISLRRQNQRLAALLNETPANPAQSSTAANKALKESSGSNGSLTLHLRTRVETFKGSGIWDEAVIERTVPTSKTAIIICDMWDKHWCEGASRRCDELAARMAPVIDGARSTGVQIIHSPSDTMTFYSDWPQRRRLILTAEIPLPKALEIPDPKLPINDSDGGCDTGQKPWYRAWTRENSHINFAQGDAISDNGKEIYHFLKEHGIDTIIYMGVHTNMCVLNRSFAIKQMTRWGLQCVLARDLTDTMYNPQSPPYVSHEQGTELVVQYIEKYWCPSISSRDLR
ncbi:MAG TPA: hypothetical protein VGL91_09075 [Acidobacteriota bacterium]